MQKWFEKENKASYEVVNFDHIWSNDFLIPTNLLHFTLSTKQDPVEVKDSPPIYSSKALIYEFPNTAFLDLCSELSIF